jgi:hypothetical protein
VLNDTAPVPLKIGDVTDVATANVPVKFAADDIV